MFSVDLGSHAKKSEGEKERVQEVVTVIFKTCSLVATIMGCLKMTGQGRVNLLKRAGNGSAQRIIAIAPGQELWY